VSSGNGRRRPAMLQPPPTASDPVHIIPGIARAAADGMLQATACRRLLLARCTAHCPSSTFSRARGLRQQLIQAAAATAVPQLALAAPTLAQFTRRLHVLVC
jgi:hypothetical protein